MCGRFIQISDPEKIKVSISDLEIDDTVRDRYNPHYNIAPTQNILTVLNTTPPSLTFTHWGLVPFWAKDKRIGYKMINARAETLTTKPSYREPFKKCRGIIVSDGFYEWKQSDKSKIPYFIRMKNREPFAFACLWDRWADKATGDILVSSSIITTDANSLIGEIHNRMPVILEPQHYMVWLSPDHVPEKDLLDCLHPYPSEKMETYEISKLVNSPRNDFPDLIRPSEDSKSIGQ